MSLSTGLFGQNSYSPVNFDDGRWVFVSNQKGPYWGTDYEYDTVRYYFEGDTIISNQQYRKLFFTGISYHMTTQGFEYRRVNGYSGAMRDDTLNRNIWFNGSIAYDYNLSVGDTIKVGIYQGVVIGFIDSVQYCDKYFRSFSFLNSSDPPALIENIRALDVVIYPYNGPTGYCTLNCYYEVNNVNCEPCAITILGMDDSGTQEIEIYPNPTEVKLQIFGLSDSSVITLYDYNGIMLLCLRVDKNRFDLDLTVFRHGAYLIKVETNNRTFTRKIIKK
jgi:hypothetical protein